MNEMDAFEDTDSVHSNASNAESANSKEPLKREVLSDTESSSSHASNLNDAEVLKLVSKKAKEEFCGLDEEAISRISNGQAPNDEEKKVI